MSDGEWKVEVHEAITKARGYFSDLFGSEPVSQVGLEEVEHDYDGWKVTIGFYRPAPPSASMLANLTSNQGSTRWYKVVTVSDADGRLISIKNREPNPR
jgi:hypothetical protein